MKRRAAKTLAMPFVLTALLSPSFADNTPPTQNPPPPPQKKKLPKAPNEAGVTRHEDGTCWYYHSPQCPPNVHCNPPPPHEVECPPEKKK